MTAVEVALKDNVSKVVKSKASVRTRPTAATAATFSRFPAPLIQSRFLFTEHDGRYWSSGGRSDAGAHSGGVQGHLPEHRAARVRERLPEHVPTNQRQLQTRHTGM